MDSVARKGKRQQRQPPSQFDGKASLEVTEKPSGIPVKRLARRAVEVATFRAGPRLAQEYPALAAL
jgi:hypothetical protein